jgi:pentatricopeptide repeat protein
MLKDYEADNSNVKPNTLCFDQVIYAWAKSPDEDASKRAEMVLKLMEDMYSNGNEDVMPSTRTYNVVLYALASGEEDDAPIRASLLLDRMRNEHRHGNDAMKPDAVSYSTVISAWANHGGLGSVNATIMLLEDLYESGIEVDSSFFSNLIHSLTRTGAEEAPTAAEIIILDLIKRGESGEVDIRVDTEIYNALINCWGKSGNRGSAARAEEILQDMEDEYAEGNAHVQPNVQTFTSVIDAYAKSRDTDEAERAEHILNRMEDDGIVRPNAHTYTAVIQAYARSNRSSKAKHAQSILFRMKDDFANGNSDARPSVVTYNAVLNACEFSVGEASEMEEAFQIACDTLDEIRSCDYLSPDSITYGTFLGVIAKLMPKSETTNELIELVFKRCCADGQLGPVALKKLGDAASVSRYRRLLGGTEENLPAEWSRNVEVPR